MTTRHRITTAAAVAVALAAGAGPAWAFPADQTPNGSQVPAGSPYVTGAASAPAAPTIVRVTPTDAGFDWGDAGIGAGGALALSLVALGGAVLVSGRRGRHPHNTIRTS
ncbi:MAG TPA: hypothetical protein VMD09_13290 [Solirubrobacteraceae bacterium]|nr:hypothetical protein [Solirubrobacteraceae bacterium]